MDETTEVARSAVAPESGAELEYDADSTGISVRGTGLYGPGIGRVGFVLIDLRQEPPANVLDRGDVNYTAPLPERVTEAWRSAALVPGAPYRVFFHVYDRSGVNLVAYDRRDFTWHERTDRSQEMKPPASHEDTHGPTAITRGPVPEPRRLTKMSCLQRRT